MGELNYSSLIKDMTWSYSRLNSFEDCPYRWYLKYIKYPKAEKKELFFASYGSFMHELLAEYYAANKTAEDIRAEYLINFRKNVFSPAPSHQVFQSYFKDGLEYLSNLGDRPKEVLGVEQKMLFNIDGIQMTGFLDLLIGEDNKLILEDHKSRNLKPRSNRTKPTKADQELDTYLRQLYIYSHYIKETYGKFPDELWFNTFRQKTVVKEPFHMDAYLQAKQWVKDTVETICNESEFLPAVEFFKCKYLCECQDLCEYYQINFGR